MQAPPKKKKKYVLMKPERQQNAPNPQAQSALARQRFDYSFQQILSHLFARLLPDSRFIIRFSEKLIFGKESELKELIDAFDENVKYYTGVVLELEDDTDREDIEFELQQRYRAKLFGGKLIEKCILDFFNGSKYQLECGAFLRLFQEERRPRLYLRIDRQFAQEFLQKIGRLAHPIRATSISDRALIRGNRKELRKEIKTVTVQAADFDGKHFKEWLHRSEKLDKRDIEVVENRNALGYTETVTAKLLCYEGDEERKLEAFNYYFLHQNFISLPLQDSPHKADLIKRHSSISTRSLKVELVRGYRSSKWDQNTLLYKLRCNQVPARKTNFNNELIEVFLLSGLLTRVREYLELLQQDINNVPLDDATEQLFLEIPDEQLKDIMRSSEEVQGFVENFVRGWAKRVEEVCAIKEVKFPVRAMKLKVMVRAGKEKEFEKWARPRLQTAMMQQLRLRRFQTDFLVDKEFIEKLKKEGVMVVDSEERAVRYLQSHDNMEATLTTIQNAQAEFQALGEQEIEVKGKSKLVRIQQLIDDVRSKQDYQQIFLVPPETKDRINFRLTFIGPRKRNNQFANTIRQKILQLELTLGAYYQEVSKEEGKFLVGAAALEEQMEKDFHISIFVDPAIVSDAVLQLEPMAIQRKVKVIRGNSLRRVPVGSSIYFSSRAQLDIFQEKSLKILKLKANRMKRSELIREEDQQRNLSLFYKEGANPVELLSIALDVEKDDSFCLIMPQTKQQVFMKEVLTILTSNRAYESFSFTLIILETNPKVDIPAVVALPDYASVQAQQQTVVEWYCQGSPYSKVGNDKINSSIANGSSKCLIMEQDLSRQSSARTHSCNLAKSTLKCLKTGVQILLSNLNGVLGFRHKGYELQFTARQENLVKYYSQSSMSGSFYLSLFYYQLDLIALTQSNLFTGKTRKIEAREKVAAGSGEYGGKVHAYYQVETPHLIYSYQNEQERHLLNATQVVANYIESKRVKETIQLKAVDAGNRHHLVELIKIKAQENQINSTYLPDRNQVVVVSLCGEDVENFRQAVERQVEYLLTLERAETTNKLMKGVLVFPPCWQPQAKDIHIQKFKVSPNSIEFQDVQKLFGIRPIVLLQRIQNKYLYGKYTGEMDHLTFLNGGQRPKEMQLFHGTQKNNPELIWGDKEEGFNVNYSSTSNLLGMGIYFAQSAQYSHNYSFRDDMGVRSMFLCNVIVGDSQEMSMNHSNSHVKDTNFKNKQGLRYESMKGKHSICDIYVVYKDKRAYPHYLIHYQS